MDTHINLDTVEDFNRLHGLTTYHPLVTVADLRHSTLSAQGNMTMRYGLYALYLKNGAHCVLRYGRREYDYQQGSVVTFAPGQTVEVIQPPQPQPNDVLAILFHPDLIYGSVLADKMQKYDYFDYSQTEAVHLSEPEREIFIECFDKLKREVEHPVDRHSADLLTANLQLLFEYLYRFYDRQFITRHKVNSEIVRQFERELDNFFAAGHVRVGLPTVAYFAEKACLSPGYFSDLIKKETGSGVKDLLTLRLVSEAKKSLMATDCDISQIAYRLGFEYPQHFTRLFKRQTGLSPSQYRLSSANKPN